MQGVDGVKTIIKEDNTPDLFDFLGRYVRKTHTDDLILKKLRASPGISYLDVIRPSDIAYVIALMKNAREIWDQDLRLSAGGEAVMGNKETKVKPKFTGGKGQKRMKGKSLWNKEGMTYFKTAEKNWRRVYEDETLIQVLYQGWDLWLEVYGKDLKIGDGTNKTYFSVMATWNDNEIDDGEMVSKRGTGNLSGDESVDSDGGYNSDNCGASGRRNWKDLKSKQAGEEIAQRNTQSFQADLLSNNEVGEEDRFDKERERMQKKKRKADGRRNEIEAKRTSPRKGSTEDPMSPPGISVRSKK